MSRLESAELETPIGTLLLFVREGVLRAVSFVEHRARVVRELEARFGPADLEPDPDPGGFAGCFRAYFDGELGALDKIPVETGGTSFQRRVWLALREIPPGRTLCYGELARRIGAPSAVRAVGAANGRNPVPIVLPCHRVIGADGSLTGYGGGLERKRWLLEHEGASFREHRPRQARLPFG